MYYQETPFRDDCIREKPEGRTGFPSFGNKEHKCKIMHIRREEWEKYVEVLPPWPLGVVGFFVYVQNIFIDMITD